MIQESPSFWMEALKYLVAPLIAGFAAALSINVFGAHFGFRRYRKEQWWQEKRKAYDSIIKELARMKFNASSYIDHVEMGGQRNYGEIKARENISWSLKEVSSAGTYIVSKRTVDEVADVLVVWESDGLIGDPFIHAGKVYEKTNKVIDIVRAEAHKDLKVMDSPIWLRKVKFWSRGEDQ